MLHLADCVMDIDRILQRSGDIVQMTKQCVSSAGAVRGGEALVGRAVAKRFGPSQELFRGKVGYYAPRLCPKA